MSREEARFSTTAEGLRIRTAITKQFWDDWFHTLAYQRTIVLMMILFFIYTAIVFNFAFIYLFVSKLGQREKVNPDGTISTLPFCDMDIHDHMEALYFSLSTMTTIGYGVSDYYFGGCWTPLLLVLAQVCSAITFDAVAIGLLFQRISRGHKRGKTILFSDKAVIRRVKGVPYLMFRVGELRKHQLLQSSVRAYCIRHERHLVEPSAGTHQGEGTRTTSNDRIEARDGGNNYLGNDGVSDLTLERVGDHAIPTIETVHYVTRPLKLLSEEETGSSSILMSLPQVLAHRIDPSSPLFPPAPVWYDADGCPHQVTDVTCSTEELEDFAYDREVEIVVLLEGTDELTGSASQTRHSYTTADLGWNQSFVPCVYPHTTESDDGNVNQPTRGLFRRRRQRSNSTPRRSWGRRGRDSISPAVCVVDFARFHDTIPAPEDSATCPFVIE